MSVPSSPLGDRTPILPGATIGVLGGGQLGRAHGAAEGPQQPISPKNIGSGRWSLEGDVGAVYRQRQLLILGEAGGGVQIWISAHQDDVQTCTRERQERSEGCAAWLALHRPHEDNAQVRILGDNDGGTVDPHQLRDLPKADQADLLLRLAEQLTRDCDLFLAVGSSLVSVSLFGFTTSATYALQGDVLWDVAGLMIAGGVIGSTLGIAAGRRLSNHRSVLQRLFSGFVIFVAGYVVWRTVNGA